MPGIQSILLLTLLLADKPSDLPNGGGWRDTVMVVSSQSTLQIADPWIIVESLRLERSGIALQPGVNFTYLDSLHQVTFLGASRPAPGDSITIHYQSAAVTRTLEFQLYQPGSHPVTAVTSSPGFTPTEPSGDNGSAAIWEGLKHSGSITRGIRMGQGGDAGMTSGLHLELSGKLAHDMEVEALLDDRNLPITGSGSSTTLSELDRMSLRVASPHVESELGDFDLSWERGNFGNINRRMKGVKLKAGNPRVEGEVVASGGETRYREIVLLGRDGDQGPYELTDRFGSPGIVVETGSDRVYLNGKPMTRGRTADYIIDCQRGAIIFNPVQVIRSDSRIEVEYQYTEDSYSRYFYAASIHTPMPLTGGLTLSTTAVLEGMDQNHPLAFEWNDSWRRQARQAGDNPLGLQVPGVDSVEMGQGDYIWTVSGTDTILKFSTPDSLGRPTGYLRADFTKESGGAYERGYNSDYLVFYYAWVGRGLGEWAPVRVIPLPEKTGFIDFDMNYAADGLRLTGELAYSNTDRNTLSSYDDGDNGGMGFDLSGDWSSGGIRPVKVTTKLRRQDSNFRTASREREVDHDYRWSIPPGDSSAETSIESSVNCQVAPALALTGDLGQLERGGFYRARRLGLHGSAHAVQTAMQFDFARTEGKLLQTNGSSLRDRWAGAAERDQGTFRPSYALAIEDYTASGKIAAQPGRRSVEHQAELGCYYAASGNAKLDLSYRQDFDRTGGKHILQSDTRTWRARWDESGPGWGGLSLSAIRYLQTHTDPILPKLFSTSGKLDLRISPRESIWNLSLSYYLRTGNDRAGAVTASYVGANHGGYRREGDRFVADPQGDFNLIEILTDTLRQSSDVNLTAGFELRPRRRNVAGDRETFPLGISRSNSRVEADLTTVARDPWRAFILAPNEFGRRETVVSRVLLQEELYFLEGATTGDGRLTLRHQIARNQTTASGESQSNDLVSLRIRQRLSSSWWMMMEPAWERQTRKELIRHETRADVVSIGGSVEIGAKPPPGRIEYALPFGFEQRRDRIETASLNEVRITPRLTANIQRAGTLRMEGEWRRLSSNRSHPGYDLTGAWSLGDNWRISAGVDYRIGKSFTAGASFDSVWRGSAKPYKTLLMELTAKF